MLLALNYLTWGIVFLTEPVFLSTWGTTPGKWLMGLSVRDGETPPPPLQYTLTDGAVTAVTVENDREPSLMGGSRGSQVVMVMAFLGARREVNPFNLIPAVNAIPEEVGWDLKNYSVSFSGLTVTNEVAYSGYEDFAGMFLVPLEGEQQSYHQVFRIEMME